MELSANAHDHTPNFSGEKKADNRMGCPFLLPYVNYYFPIFSNARSKATTSI